MFELWIRQRDDKPGDFKFLTMARLTHAGDLEFYISPNLVMEGLRLLKAAEQVHMLIHKSHFRMTYCSTTSYHQLK